MRIKETSANLFPVKTYKNRVITIFYFKVCSPRDPLNPLYCIFTQYMLVSGRGGTYFKTGNGDDPIIISFTRYKFAFIYVSVMLKCN